MHYYCVYVHKVNGIPFYVGMGNIEAPYIYPYGRNEEWLDIYYEYFKQINVEIVESNLTFKDAQTLRSKTFTQLLENHTFYNSIFNEDQLMFINQNSHEMLMIQQFEQIHESFVFYKEPSHIKLYDLNALRKITNFNVLFALLPRADKNGVIKLTPSLREEIAKECDYSHSNTLNNAFTYLTKKGIITRVKKDVYRLNPALFGRG